MPKSSAGEVRAGVMIESGVLRLVVFLYVSITLSQATSLVPGLLTVVGCTKTISRTAWGCQAVVLCIHLSSMT